MYPEYQSCYFGTLCLLILGILYILLLITGGSCLGGLGKGYMMCLDSLGLEVEEWRSSCLRVSLLILRL